jgi:hypothetical protein
MESIASESLSTWNASFGKQPVQPGKHCAQHDSRAGRVKRTPHSVDRSRFAWKKALTFPLVGMPAGASWQDQLAKGAADPDGSR